MARISATTIVLIIVALGVLCTDASAMSCCRKYTKVVIPIAIIRGYSIQTIRGRCNIDAVIFHTNRGKNICTDPSKTWVMDNISKLREKVQAIKKKHSK
ncbi:C-C motif chemokine 20-like [Myxocyprinus asiaticus]|uniref:C-C motif chemokine 20-like n=1 Tax=Myxocyprinus asiaticus TaxID=70543 RepID=UPI002221AEE2|nr:C-C motif chemokine 20-like [Myxocyprinus asiaticus]